MSIQAAARFAEIVTSPAYREALNSAYAQNPEVYNDQQMTAERILLETQNASAPQEAINWETRRRAALATLRGEDLGAFNGYLQSFGGTQQPGDMDKDQLGMGEPGPVRTNSIIRSVSEVYEEPIDFLETAMSRITDRLTEGRVAVGPENYATTIKYFSDKYKDFPSQHLDQTKIAELVGRWAEGFAWIASKDRPNFVEMTNIYHAVRTLPKGSFPDSFTKTLVEHSLEQLPTFHRNMVPVFYGALAKVSSVQAPQELATLVDLSLRQLSAFETTREMRLALRAVANLQPSEQANRTFGTFLELRNNLEEPMDLEGLDETSELLVRIVNDVIDDPALTLQAQEVAKTCAQRAIPHYKKAETLGEVSESQLAYLHTVVDRIVNRYSKLI